MRRIALYSGFVTASLADAVIFLTSNNYIQLVFAILLYLPLTYVAFKLFPRKTQSENLDVQTVSKDNTVDNTLSETSKPSEVEILDVDKRVFLKLIGVTGLSFFISSLFTRKFGTLPGTSEETGVTSIKDPAGNIINPAKHQPTDNYKISEVDYGIESFYGFIDENDNWFIMKEDSNAGTYRYTKGENNFSDNWNNRENLKYDYYNRVFSKS
ncbi:hypothetical protein M1307_03180 [Patescibacteria group bacterium]|nr:hypothetical protein [Patescibacteria group bacterium]